MPMPSASLEFNIDIDNVIARGVSFTNEQLEEMLADPVKDIIADLHGYPSNSEYDIKLGQAERGKPKKVVKE